MENLLTATIARQFLDTSANLRQMAEDGVLLNTKAEVIQAFVEALGQGNQILFPVNGRSAADPQHLAGELVGRFAYHKARIAGLCAYREHFSAYYHRKRLWLQVSVRPTGGGRGHERRRFHWHFYVWSIRQRS